MYVLSEVWLVLDWKTRFRLPAVRVCWEAKSGPIVEDAGGLAVSALTIFWEVGWIAGERRSIPHGSPKRGLLRVAALRVFVKPKVAARSTYGVETVIGRILSVALVGLGGCAWRVRVGASPSRERNGLGRWHWVRPKRSLLSKPDDAAMKELEMVAATRSV